jgi:hypothetical protein
MNVVGASLSVYFNANMILSMRFLVMYAFRRNGAPDIMSIGDVDHQTGAIVNADEARHVENAAKEDIKLVEIHLPLDTLFRLRYEDIGYVFLGDAHLEQVELPTLAHNLAFGIRNAVAPSATSPWPCLRP